MTPRRHSRRELLRALADYDRDRRNGEYIDDDDIDMFADLVRVVLATEPQRLLAALFADEERDS